MVSARSMEWKRHGIKEGSIGATQKGGFQKDSFLAPDTGTRVHSDVPRHQRLERGYIRMFPGAKKRNEGTFAKTALLFPLESRRGIVGLPGLAESHGGSFGLFLGHFFQNERFTGQEGVVWKGAKQTLSLPHQSS